MDFDRREFQTVAVIFLSSAQKEIEALAATMPVWVIESSENACAATAARQKGVETLTVFFKRVGESKTSMCSRVLYDIDDHHQFDCLEIYGASLSDIDPEVVSALELIDQQQTEYGCRLTRRTQR